MKKITSLFTAATLALSCAAFAHEGHDQDKESTKAEKGETASVTVKGEVVDLVCYLDHGAEGEKHAKCANTCISEGLPVGIKADDGKLYTVVGAHKPLNKELAQYAGKTVALRGKVVSKDGMNLLENAEVVK
jgi:hypothetical protein